MTFIEILIPNFINIQSSLIDQTSLVDCDIYIPSIDKFSS